LVEGHLWKLVAGPTSHFCNQSANFASQASLFGPRWLLLKMMRTSSLERISLETVSLASEDQAAGAAAMVTPVSATMSSEMLLDRVITEMFGRVKFSKIKQVLVENEIEDLVELAMYDYNELVEMQGSVPNPDAPSGFEAVSLTKTQAKKLNLLKQWYKSQPNPIYCNMA
jgi:hypothetical protein